MAEPTTREPTQAERETAMLHATVYQNVADKCATAADRTPDGELHRHLRGFWMLADAIAGEYRKVANGAHIDL